MTRLLLLLPLLPVAIAGPAPAQSFRDADCNGGIDERDRAAVVRRLFAAAPATCQAADVNRDGQANAGDLVAFSRGPTVAFLGIASPDGQPAPSLGRLEDGTPVYFRNAGFGFLIVVEASPPPSGAPIGTSIMDSAPGDPSRRPDLQIIADRPLGNGSREICDEFGVPGDAGLDFSALTQSLADTINDLSCRFDVATRPNTACTQNSFGQLGFVASATRAQFCLPVASGMTFPSGDTQIAVQLRDASGLVGPVQRMLLRIENGPFPPTFTPVPPTATPTATDTLTPTATATVTRTASHTPTASRTRTATRTATPTETPSRTATRSQTPTPSITATRSATQTRTVATTPTATRTGPTATATRTASGGATPTRTATRTSTATRTRTATPNGTATRTGTRTRTATVTPSPPPSPTVTRTRTISPTPTATANARGPEITFFGVTRADDILLESTGVENGVPVYEPAFGFAFSLVVEAKPGPTRARVGNASFIDGDSPDLQVQVTRPLGDGSALVCDDMPPLLGGVPAINPPSFENTAANADRLNDLGCRFIDGSGERVGRQCGESTACVLGGDGIFACASAEATIQFCGFIGQALTFPAGDTLVTVRVRDVQGNFGAARQLLVRVR
jgi:hypothetical protein